jgi:formylglycine-generating enzyme
MSTASPGADSSVRCEFPQIVRVPTGDTLAGFWLGRTPVTNLEFVPFLASGLAAEPPWWRDPGFGAPAQPVVGVTWQDAMGYCEWLCEVAGGMWRLPSEDEWEWAACGGLRSPRTAWGETIPPGEIPEGPLAGPWEAGRGTPNGFGLCDMGTIVHEWCVNWADPPASPRRRASRGGSWRHQIRWSSPSSQSSLPPGYRYSDYGFRVLREAAGAGAA